MAQRRPPNPVPGCGRPPLTRVPHAPARLPFPPPGYETGLIPFGIHEMIPARPLQHRDQTAYSLNTIDPDIRGRTFSFAWQREEMWNTRAIHEIDSSEGDQEINPTRNLSEYQEVGERSRYTIEYRRILEEVEKRDQVEGAEGRVDETV